MMIPESILDHQATESEQTSEDEVRRAWVRESRFGRWFLTSKTWLRYVLSPAVNDFAKLLGARSSPTTKILDAGCGRGLAFALLEKHFQPKTIIGVDIDVEEIDFANRAVEKCPCEVRLEPGSITHLTLASDSIDVIFCHQLLHHVANQGQVLTEFYRVLKPGGVLLVGESCRSFIETFIVRHFFNHPKGVQKSPEGYVALVKSQGFAVADTDIQTATPFWSLPDYGLRQKWGLIGKISGVKEATEVLIVAVKPI